MRRGGSGAFTAALAKAVLEHGGEVRTGTPAARIGIVDRRATGVVLASGEEVAARQVVAATDPITLFTKLVDPHHLPVEARAELRAIPALSHNLATFKADIALAHRPQFPSHGADAAVLANGLLASGLDALHAATLEATCGRLANPPVVQFWLPSVFDRTLVPPDAEGETLYLSSVVAPLALSGDKDWSAEGPAYFEACMDVLERYAPGTRASVLGASVVTPADMAGHVHKGNPYHVDLVLGALGPWRPTPSLSGYRTPISGLWHTGAGSHPTPGISGVNGRSAATAFLRALATTARR